MWMHATLAVSLLAMAAEPDESPKSEAVVSSPTAIEPDRRGEGEGEGEKELEGEGEGEGHSAGEGQGEGEGHGEGEGRSEGHSEGDGEPELDGAEPEAAGPWFSEPEVEPTPVPDPRASVETAASNEPPRTWTVGASVDAAYLLSTNFPRNHVYRGMVPTPRLGEVTPNVVAASIDHMITDQEPWRFELLLHAGAGVDALIEPEPVPGGAGGRYAGAEVFKHIGLANAGFRLRSGTTIEGGLLPAPLGLEWFWPHRNAHQTVSWTANGTPFYLMGGHVSQALPAGLTVFAWVVNGWQTMADANGVPSYLAGLSWAPRDELLAAAMLYFGPDDLDVSPEAWRVHGDAFVSWSGERLGLAAVWDAGRERVTSLPGAPVALWTGGALFARGTVLSREHATLDLAARPEAWWDRDGRIFGVAQWLVSATGTMSVHLYRHLTVRTEYRFDHSTAPEGFFFRRTATTDGALGLARNQHVILLSLAGYVRHAFALRRP
ncbi:MAG: outer membrane beta-barrel protein [Myxococcales bacterium]|nr:outer membrane beta-barrel protein [Myxococcales bacterium]